MEGILRETFQIKRISSAVACINLLLTRCTCSYIAVPVPPPTLAQLIEEEAVGYMKTH